MPNPKQSQIELVVIAQVIPQGPWAHEQERGQVPTLSTNCRDEALQVKKETTRWYSFKTARRWTNVSYAKSLSTLYFAPTTLMFRVFFLPPLSVSKLIAEPSFSDPPTPRGKQWSTSFWVHTWFGGLAVWQLSSVTAWRSNGLAVWQYGGYNKVNW